MPSFKMLCPECRAPLVVEVEPREKQTREHLGAHAVIYADGCPHADDIPTDDLWEEFHQRWYPRREE
jgi:uncharacterized protein YbaR (Trm112 family)